MQKHYNYLDIDLDNKNNYRRLNAMQGDIKTRYILVNLYSNNLAYDLSNCTVKIYGLKRDKTIFFNNAVITNEKLGQFEIELTNQALAVAGELKIQILVLGAAGEKLTSSAFFIDVGESIIDENAIESANEFNALTESLTKVNEWDSYFEETSGKIEEKYTERLNSVGSQIKDIETSNLYNNPRNLECYFKSESLHIGEYKGENAFNGDKFINSSPNVSGWVNNNAGEWIEFYLPFGVVIGDSIAEGHPNAHGRLHTSAGVVNLDKANEEGQISYYFEKLLNMKIYNHGIGGQLTDSILSRFDRDVLGKDVAVLVPTRTLNNKCKFCIVVAGTNDILNNKSTSFTINNLEQMIKKCEENNIYGVFYTLGVCQVYTSEQVTKVEEINKYLKSRLAYSSHCSMFDYFEYVNDVSNYGKPKAGLMVDGTHPTKTTYAKIADKIYNENLLKSKIAIIPKYLNISTLINPDSGFSGLARPTVLKVEYNTGVKKIINTNNVSLYQDEIPRENIIESAKITIISGIQPYERPTVDLRNYAIGEIYCSDILDTSGILGIGKIIEVPTLMDSIGADRIMLSPTTYSQADNIPYIFGITLRDSTVEKNLVSDGICRIETTDICNEGDYIITTVAGRGKKVTNLETDKPIAKCLKYLGVSGSYHKCLVRLL